MMMIDDDDGDERSSSTSWWSASIMSIFFICIIAHRRHLVALPWRYLLISYDHMILSSYNLIILIMIYFDHTTVSWNDHILLPLKASFLDKDFLHNFILRLDLVRIKFESFTVVKIHFIAKTLSQKQDQNDVPVLFNPKIIVYEI